MKCDKPCKDNFERTGCCNFEGDIIHYQSPLLSKWVTLKSVETSFENQFKNILANESRTTIEDYEPPVSKSIDAPNTISLLVNDDEGTIQKAVPQLFLENSIASLKELKIPSFSATNSVLRNNINLKKTNVFKTPLIPGPASDYSSIYTALMKAQGISVWTCGAGSKSVISLDQDLYEKSYLLVHSRSDMRNKYILCLGELHAVFAHIRAIENLIIHLESKTLG